MDNQVQSYLTEPLDFSLSPREIDYFKIPVEQLRSDGFTVDTHDLKPVPNAPFTTEDLEGLTEDNRETVIFNMQTGKGKTTVCYDLIEKYANAGYIVFMVSPFKKLIEKDYEALNGLNVGVFNYNDIETLDLEAYREEDIDTYIQPALGKNVQIMTINCLLQNPGEDTPRQSHVKRKYLDELFEACRINGHKVVIFIDEIHESITNFHFDYIPNLLRWEPLVHKCFVSSATFIPASFPVIKYISMLTGGCIRVYDMPRHKLQDANGNLSSASLHLHFVDKEYSSTSLEPLSHIADLLAKYSNGYKVNILTAYKSFTDSIMKGDTSSPIVKAIRALKPRVLTSDNNALFDADGNNIGTNFKTGINMLGNNSVLIVILPFVKNRETSFGVFSDGIPSIIQSLARIRSNGNIHIFLKRPSYVLDKDVLRMAVPDALGRNTADKSHHIQNWSLEYLKMSYHFIRSQREDIISWIDSKQKARRVDSQPTFALNYTYPSYEQYLITDSQGILVKNHASFGSDLSSYILWASITDQFCNGKLTEITYTSPMEIRVELTDATMRTVLGRYVSSDVFEACKSQSFKAAYALLTDRMANTFRTETDNVGKMTSLRLRNKFVKREKEYSLSELRRQAKFNKLILDLMVEAFSAGAISTIDPKDYVAVCLNNAIGTESACVQPTLIEFYRQLDTLRLAFLKFIEDNYVLNKDRVPTVHKDLYLILPNALTEQIVMLYNALQKEDFFIYCGAIPFLSASIDKADDGLKKSIYNEFKRYFTNIGSSMVKVDGNEEYYKVEGSLERTLASPLTEFILLR